MTLVSETQSAWDIAVERHTSGHFAEADGLYRELLAQNPADDRALHMFGMLLYQLGRGEEGLALIDRAIAIGGSVARYHGHRGMVLASLRDTGGAIIAYRRALEIDPGRTETLNNLGNALWATGDGRGSIECYRRAWAIEPEATTAANLGWALINTGAFGEAAHELERGLALHPGNGRIAELLAIALNNIGSGLLTAGEPAKALGLFLRALEVGPELFESRFNAGQALARLNRDDEAITNFSRAIELRPESAEAHNDLGNALLQRGRLDEAIAGFAESIRLDPNSSRAHNNLGNALRNRGRLNESIVSYRNGLRLEPNDAAIWNNLGSALTATGELDAAIDALARALEFRPDLAAAQSNLGNVYKEQAELDAAIAYYVRATEIDPNNQDAHSNRLYSLYFHPGYSLERIHREHAEWNARYAAALFDPRRGFVSQRSAGRRLRVGYVAPFFREHCQSFFTILLLSNHDHESVEVFAYSDAPSTDGITTRIQGYCDGWRNSAGMSPEAVAELVRADGIDILVDLSLHMAGNRLLTFARKPAPVQMTWLGYPGTTGLDTIDYRFTDPRLDPFDPTGAAGPYDRFHSETSFRLPHTFWCYDPLIDEIPTGDPPSQRNGYVTFGCLNNFCKINDGTLRLWAEIMGGTPNSRLILLAPEGRSRDRITEALGSFGVAGSRIEFVGRLPRPRYLSTYRRIDVGLDTFPYNGHTTTLDSLWMGVPVASFAGDAPVGRAGLSQLTNLDLQPLVGADERQFVRIAVELANDLDTRRALRPDLRSRMLGSPLCDGARFARDVEAAYRTIWTAHLNERRDLPNRVE